MITVLAPSMVALLTTNVGGLYRGIGELASVYRSHMNVPDSHDLLLSKNFHAAELWLDEESTDNPVDSAASYSLHDVVKYCNLVDSVEQFHQLRSVAHLFQTKTVSRTTLFKRINVATIELIGRPTSPHAQVYSATQDKMPIVIDSGASVTLSPNGSDFVGPIRPTDMTRINGLSSSTIVAGIGTVQWTIRDIMGTVRTIKTQAYYVPAATIRLFSPQKYFQEQNGGQLLLDKDGTTLTLPEGTRLQFPYQQGSFLPLMLTIDHFNLSPPTIGLTFSDVQMLQSLDDAMGLMNVADGANANLTAAQRELKLIHDKLAHCDMQRCQELTVDRTATGEKRIIIPKLKGVSSCVRPLCVSCSMGKQTRTSTKAHNQLPTTTAGGIRAGDLTPGAGVSVDQYQSSVKGRLPHTKGREAKSKKYTGGSIYYDHSSQDIFICHQISLRVGETLRAKHRYEGYCKQRGVKVRHYHADNSPFGNKAYKDDCVLQNQALTFSGVGAHHQNAVAERAIRTVTGWTRTMILHQILHWPDSSNLELWPFAMEHAVYVWNNLPKKGIRLAPVEIHSRSKFPNYDHLSSLAVWGCPTYVLEPQLQDGKKLPKWKARTRRGMYLGKSDEHANTVGRILNLDSGYISPQYHCVYDNLFSTVPSSEGGLYQDGTFDPSKWNQLIQSGHERSYEPEYDINGRLLPGPMLSDEWLSGEEKLLRKQLKAKRWRRLRQMRDLSDVPSDNRDLPAQREGDSTQQATPQREPEIEFEIGEDLDLENQPGLDFQSQTSEGDSIQEAFRRVDEALENQLDEIQRLSPFQRTRSGRRVRKPNRLISTMFTNSKPFASENIATYSDLGRQRVRQHTLDEMFLHELNWTCLADLSTISTERVFLMIIAMHQTMDYEGNTFEEWDPMILSSVANSQDNPTWNHAMNGPNKKGFWTACEIEITTLERKESWIVVERESWMHVLPSTWAFKIKRYPHGAIRKLKARFCVRGDWQVEGVDFFETFAPVVSWTTVRIMLILSILFDLKTRQVDYTAAFVHALIDADPNLEFMTQEERNRAGVYVEMPRGFREGNKVLKLQRSLYGLKQSPRNFFLHLKSKLEKFGFKQQIDLDPCLFISDKVICLVYVDDTLFFARDEKDIDEVVMFLKNENMELEVEDDVAGFLGVHIDRKKDGRITLTQLGLTDRIIRALNLGDSHGKETPAEFGTLPKDLDGEPMNGTFSYPSVIGMLLYLSGHSRPDIAFAVSQCARFTHSPTRLHEEALKRIGLYLKQTRTEGLILEPDLTNGLKLDCYVDADFAGQWGYEDKNDPSCMKSRTGFIIFMSECPILWVSKLQSEIATSTMESEYIALSTAMRDLLPLKHKVEVIGRALGQQETKVVDICKTIIHEDNTGCLKLAQMEPGRMTPRSKHYGIKYHWFRSHLIPEQIQMKETKSEHQRADFLTKSLRRLVFKQNRQLSMGW